MIKNHSKSAKSFVMNFSIKTEHKNLHDIVQIDLQSTKFNTNNVAFSTTNAFGVGDSNPIW